MDKIPSASDADYDVCEDVFCTFYAWMNSDPARKESTNKSYLKQFITLFDEDGKSFEGMSGEEYFQVTKASPRNRQCNGVRSAAAKQWNKFWVEKGEAIWKKGFGWTPANGDKLYKSRLSASRPASTKGSAEAKIAKASDFGSKPAVKEAKVVKEDPAKESKDGKRKDAGDAEEPPKKRRVEEDRDEGKNAAPKSDKEAKAVCDSTGPEANAKRVSEQDFDSAQKRRKHDHSRNDENIHEGGHDDVKTFPPVTREETEIDTDTEYPECCLEAHPEAIVAEKSGMSKLDGTYDRIPWSSRGRPCWAMRSGKKRFYLYWNRAWKFNTVFGLAKSTAHCKDAKGVLCPCEPFPFSWKVYQKESEKFEQVSCMRVFDAEGAAEDAKWFHELAPLAEQLAVKEQQQEQQQQQLHSATKDAAVQKMLKSMKTTSQQVVNKNTDDAKKADTGAIGEKVADAKKSGEIEEKSPTEESNSSSEEESSSDSESSSSNDGSEKLSSPVHSAGRIAPATVAVAAEICGKCGVKSTGGKFCTECGAKRESQHLPSASMPPLATTVQQAPSSQTQPSVADKNKEKARLFEAKLRTTLAPLVGRANEMIKQKLDYVRNSIRSQATSKTFVDISGMTVQQLESLVDSLEKEFAPVKKQVSEEPTSPMTPPDDPRDSKMNLADHRSAEPTRSALRGPWGNRRTMNRITYIPGHDLASHIEVVVYKMLGEQLWFQAPGAYVICDRCERSVPQACGRLHGPPMRGHFAQDEFYCNECAVCLLGY
eukprot:TRINITY_DN4942_c2_g1_i1.p1 TRINITY_DN4942_c2_g1~~TRINITY_DN4942_c2_g1_i1.p1  ORF type:complete len:765 (+),score=177.17 TRINITY_DN4942_c2_g1_i1:143-2437(+)